MKFITNETEIPRILASENPNWQEYIYDKIGILVAAGPGGITLFSSCGSVCLDAEAEYAYSDNNEGQDRCEIHSVSELISYILDMESYQALLVDRQVGQFTKSDLFWAIYERILLPSENCTHKDGSLYRDWVLNSIQVTGSEVELNMALMAYDECNTALPYNPELSLDEALSLLLKNLNQVNKTTPDIRPYQLLNLPYSVPHDLESLKTQLTHIGLL